MPTKVFFCEPTGIERRWLRRYSKNSKPDCCQAMPGQHSYHNAMTPIEDGPEVLGPDGYITGMDAEEFKGDQRWPLMCSCGYAFKPDDNWDVHRRSLYKRLDDPQALPRPLEDLPAGAMWNAWWMAKHGAWRGPDGMCLVARCPDGHDWTVDGRASNCTMPNDSVHKCWVRHGDPRSGNVHVDKNGLTCAAGAGSIQTPKYHGFLHNGSFTDG